MGFFAAVEVCLRKYAVFKGRASRSEFWWFGLFQWIVNLTFFLFTVPNEIHRFSAYKATGVMPAQSPAYTLFGLVFDIAVIGLLLPTLGVTVRRLHDVNKSGWWYFFGIVPLIGPIMLLVWVCSRGTRGMNRFGADPAISF